MADLFGPGRCVRQRTRGLRRRFERPAAKAAPSTPAPTSERSERSSGHTNRDSSRGDYTVREGDTLSGIADRHGTTWRQLHEANKAVIGADPNLIVPGQRLEL